VRRPFLTVPGFVLLGLLVAGCDEEPAAASPSTPLAEVTASAGPRRGGGRNQLARAEASAAPGQGAQKGAGAANLGDEGDDVSLCPERIRRELVVEWAGETVRKAQPERALAELGKRRLTTGRHAGQPAIGLSDLGDLVAGAGRIEIVPCKGASMTFDLTQAASDPSRFVLVSAKRGAFKLMDRDGDPKKPMIKNIAVVRLLP